MVLIKQSNKEKQNDIMEKQCICLGNIVKIKFCFLKGQKYREYLTLIDRCIFFAKNCKKDDNNIKWYQDALKLKQEIEEKMKMSDKDISLNIEKILNNIEELFKQENKMGFINYILDNAPYKGYDKNTRPPFYNWDTVNRELIEFLSKQYHPDLYPQDTVEERKDYKIIENISKKLNNLLEQITPDESMLDKRKYILK